MRTNLVIVENGKFIFDTNFAGDPKKDRFGSDERKANLVIPDIDLARELIDDGFNVRLTKPRVGEEEGFVPRYFVKVKLNYKSTWPPKVYLVTDEDKSVLLDEESVACLDDIWVDRVNAVLNRYEGPNGKSLYVKSMEVYQKVDDDPISAKYRRRNRDEEEEIPFE
jgi:hypothetical protein